MSQKKTVYLDYAAGTPVDPRVWKEMEPYIHQRFANPASLHSLGREQAGTLEDARGRVAKTLGAKPAEIIFTSGSTEGARIAIQGVGAKFPYARIVATVLEHQAVLQELHQLEGAGRHVSLVTVGSSGVIDVNQLVDSIDDLTALVCMQYVNSEIGTIQPVRAIGKLVAEIREDRRKRGITLPLYFYCDAAQAGLLSLQVSRLGVDIMTLGGSKLYGPSGGGVLYIRTGVEIEVMASGSGQERGLRGGTVNVAAAVGMAAAVEFAQSERAAESKRLLELRDWTASEIMSLEGVRINGDMKQRIASNINFSIQDVSGETALAYLDAAGFAVATGSACSAASQEPSHVLRAIGCSVLAAESSLRITFGRYTTKAELAAFVKALHQTIDKIRRQSVGV